MRRPSGEPAKLRIFSELYYPEETSTGYVMTRIAQALAERLPVQVLCAQPTYSARGIKAPKRETRLGVDICRVRSTTLSNERMVSRIANLVTVTISLFLKGLLQLRHGDRALVVTNPPILPFAIATACLLRRARCVVLVQDTYPEVLEAAGVAGPRSLLVRTLHRATRILYRFATRVVVVGRGMQAKAQAKLPANQASKVRVIRDWADTDLIQGRPRTPNPLLLELGIEDRFVIQYAGNISRLNDIENLVETMALLVDEPRLHLLVVGRGAKRDWLESEVRRRGLDNVTLADWRPRSETPDMHSGCDIVLIPLIRGMAGVSVPSRLYNSLASERPIIAVVEDESELARVVSEEQVGWVVPPSDPERLAATIRRAAGDPELLAAMGSRARAVAESRFTRKRTISQWLELFEELEAG